MPLLSFLFEFICDKNGKAGAEEVGAEFEGGGGGGGVGADVFGSVLFALI